MAKPFSREWELVSPKVFRLKVYGGWIVHFEDLFTPTTGHTALCFVPDPRHEWELEPA
jgi:hypothetical protein